MRLVIKFLKDESGVTAIEYSLIAAGIAPRRYHGCEPARHGNPEQLFYDLDKLELVAAAFAGTLRHPQADERA